MNLLSSERQGERPGTSDRFMIANAAAGVFLGFVVAAAVILLDVQGVGTLLRRSDQGLVAAILLTSGFGTLAAVGLFSTAWMWLPSRPGLPGGRLRPVLAASRRRA